MAENSINCDDSKEVNELNHVDNVDNGDQIIDQEIQESKVPDLEIQTIEKVQLSDSPQPSPRQQAATSNASRYHSYRQGMTRAERLKIMINQAKLKARKVRLGEGMKSVFRASMDDIGALGIGMQLYFMLTKYLSVVFLCMGLISLPAVVVNMYGHGITSKLVDPLQLAYSSIGNGGVNDDTAASVRNCLPIGDIDCTWKTVDTPLTSNPKTVTWIITLTDVVYSFFFLCFLLFYSYRATIAIQEHQTKHLTPARYSVLVRGLPKDATEREILEHFNTRYDLTKPESYCKLWFGCCWGRRHLVKHSHSSNAINRNVVSNVDHLEHSTTISKEFYKNTWIAEVSVAHPTGGLLRAYLSTKHLGEKKEEIEALIQTLEDEKRLYPTEFQPADEKLIHASRKKLEKLHSRLAKHEREIEIIKHVVPKSDKMQEKKKRMEMKAKNATSKEKLAAAALAAKTAATNTQQAFNWEACECAFVVFNNLESRRRCLQDYRNSTRYLSRKWQPKELRYHGFPLIVTTAPEPSNILWENLEVTNRGRFYRQFVTNLITVMLLVISCAIISAAQTTQEQFASKSPPEGLCDRALPAVYYADTSFAFNAQKKTIPWTLMWDSSRTCTIDKSGEARYYISYSNHIVNNLNTSKISYGPEYRNPKRCVDSCISDSSSDICHTLPCFYYNDLVRMKGFTCQAYEASHVLSCFCSTQLLESIQKYGFINGSKRLWTILPCRGFTKDYLLKNAFTLLAAGIVVIVNSLLKTILRMFAVFERHTSESTKIIRVAIRMFGAQFLNTAVIVMIVNASFGLRTVPVVKELLGGKFRDFERGWYPTVGMGIATTMLLNAFLPQITLLVQMWLVSPLLQWYKRRAIRTQAKMDKLYAGPTFDISLRYPMVLNTVFVTMVFCGGSPVLLYIAVVAATGIYWLDKLSILYLYSVKTTYDEILGEVTLQVLPWTLALHLGFSAWMYGNPDLLQGTMLDLPWLLKTIGLSSVVKQHPNATADELYEILTNEVEKYDVLGPHGLLVKIIYSHVMLMTVLCLIVTLSLLLYTIFGTIVFVVLRQMWTIIKHALLFPVKQILSLCLKIDNQLISKTTKKPSSVVYLPEFAEPFVMSVTRPYKADEGLGFHKHLTENTYKVTCIWPEDTLDGLERVAGDPKLTWETMQAPVKSYAIEANEKYRHSVKQVLKAWQIVKKNQKLDISPELVAIDVQLTNPSLEDKVNNKDNKSLDAPIEAIRPEEVVETKISIDEDESLNYVNEKGQDEEREGQVEKGLSTNDVEKKDQDTSNDVKDEGQDIDTLSSEARDESQDMKVVTVEVNGEGQNLEVLSNEVNEEGRCVENSSLEVNEEGRDVNLKSNDVTKEGQDMNVSILEVKEEGHNIKISSLIVNSEGQDTTALPLKVKEEDQEIEVSSNGVKEESQDSEVSSLEVKDEGEDVEVSSNEGEDFEVISKESEEGEQKINVESSEAKEESQDIAVSSLVVQEEGEDFKVSLKDAEEGDEDITVPSLEAKEEGHDIEASLDGVNEENQVVEVSSLEVKDEGKDIATLNEGGAFGVCLNHAEEEDQDINVPCQVADVEVQDSAVSSLTVQEVGEDFGVSLKDAEEGDRDITVPSLEAEEEGHGIEASSNGVKEESQDVKVSSLEVKDEGRDVEVSLNEGEDYGVLFKESEGSEQENNVQLSEAKEESQDNEVSTLEAKEEGHDIEASSNGDKEESQVVEVSSLEVKDEGGDVELSLNDDENEGKNDVQEEIKGFEGQNVEASAIEPKRMR
ncbi:hypothetical protein Plhal304r1_c030g0097181 [Plasmopara halstedii]